MGGYFAVFLILYLVVFTKLHLVLKSRHPDFYKDNKKRLIILGCSIITSMIFRIFFTFVFTYEGLKNLMHKLRLHESELISIFFAG